MKITVIPGDGIGPEITNVTLKILEALNLNISCEILEAGEIAIKKYNSPLPKHVLDSIRKNKIALKGPLTTPIGEGFRSVNVALRQELDLFACVRICSSYEGIPSKYKNIDITVIRENTEDLYTGVEFPKGSDEAKKIIELSNKRLRDDSAISIKSISEFASRRIINFAFEYAKKNDKKKVTVVTKANILKFSDGLFLETAREIAKKFSDIEFEEKLVDNMCMQLVVKPELYSVLVLPNLYGDIISDLCAGLVGGLGVVPSVNISDEIAVFEPIHGSAPKYKGLNKANPLAMILSLKLLLEYINETEPAKKLDLAVRNVLKDGKKLTFDLGGISSTTEFGTEIIRKISTL